MVEGGGRPAFLHAEARRPRRVQAQPCSRRSTSIWERAGHERPVRLRYGSRSYTPADKRVHGYYVLPFLLGERIAARVDLKADRKARVLRVQAAHREPDAPPETERLLAEELELMAGWLDLDGVTVANRGDLGVRLRAVLESMKPAPA